MLSPQPTEPLRAHHAEEFFAERVRALVESRCGYSPRPAARSLMVAAITRHRAGRSFDA